MKLGSIALPVAIIGMVLLIILPIPTMLLDILIAINIALSLIILLNTIYTEEPLQFSIFPALLLLSTVYRLSLNISTAKTILVDGKTGTVVTAFGNFVVGGNMVAGFVIFLIITLVNFLVITKGSERVSEVAARFTLDAMPGKQMAIDADLNAGLINEKEAKDRRKKIQREADFYGSMDGASKFVKGDAIAGIIIIIINSVGGLIIGMLMRNEPLMDALKNYTLLSVGDGLVSQVPALLISTATGIMVTRSGSEGSLSGDFFAQLFQNPTVLALAAAASGFLGIMPGLPSIPFFTLALALGISAYTIKQSIKKDVEKEQIAVEESEVEEIRRPENVVSLLQVDPIELEFGYGIIPIADVNQGGDLLDRVVMIRRQIALELGMIVPVIRLRDNIQLAPNDYLIKIKGVEVAKGQIMFDHYLAMNPGTADEEIDGVKTIEPAFGLPAIWIKEAQRERAEMIGYTVVDPPSIISTHLTELIKKHADELLGRQDVQTLVDNIKQLYPTIVEELIPKQMTIGEVQKILANLLREGVSIRDMVTILETLADYAPVTHDPDVLTEYVRQGLGRAISKKFISDSKASVITLDPDLEQTILESVKQTEHGSYLTLSPDISQNIISSLMRHINTISSFGQQAIVVAKPLVRLYFKRLTEQAVPGLVVLSYNELDPNVEIQSVGVVSI